MFSLQTILRSVSKTVQKLELSKKKDYIAKMHLLQRNCNTREINVFIQISAIFKQCQNGAKWKYFSRAFQWYRIWFNSFFLIYWRNQQLQSVFFFHPGHHVCSPDKALHTHPKYRVLRSPMTLTYLADDHWDKLFNRFDSGNSTSVWMREFA